MKRSWNALYKLLWSMALAMTLILVVLGINANWSHAHPSITPSPEPMGGWDDDTPVGIYFSGTSTLRWEIPQYNVVITIPKTVFPTGQGQSYPGYFTFTPQSGYTLPVPMTALDHFFLLEGEYAIGSQEGEQVRGQISFNTNTPPHLEWHYTSGNLDGVLESTLSFYEHINIFGKKWQEHNGIVDMEANTASLDLPREGTYGFGGYKGQVFLPWTMHEEPHPETRAP